MQGYLSGVGWLTDPAASQSLLASQALPRTNLIPRMKHLIYRGLNSTLFIYVCMYRTARTMYIPTYTVPSTYYNYIVGGQFKLQLPTGCASRVCRRPTEYTSHPIHHPSGSQLTTFILPLPGQHMVIQYIVLSSLGITRIDESNITATYLQQYLIFILQLFKLLLFQVRGSIRQSRPSSLDNLSQQYLYSATP